MEDVGSTVVTYELDSNAGQDVSPQDEALSTMCSSTNTNIANCIDFKLKAEENTQIDNSINKSNVDQNEIVHGVPNHIVTEENSIPSDNFISDSLDSQTSTVIESAADNIMSVCSSTAQHIKQTITDVLNLRKEEENNTVLSEINKNNIESSLKEKIADFEISVLSNFSEKNDKRSEIFSENNTSQILVNSEVPIVEELQLLPENSDSEVAELESTHVNLPVVENDSTVNASTPENKESNGCENYVNNEVFLQALTLTDEKSTKKSQKSSGSKKKGEKTVDQILKSLSEFSTPESKLQNLCKRHSEMQEELRLCELRLKQNERQAVQLAREKEQLQAEHNRMILAKSRLESLCRELQRQNKAVKEESLLRIREEEEKRKDVASKFQTTLNEISTLMQDNSKKNLQLKEENAELAQKLKSLVEHYEMWEKHMEKVVQQKDLEAQLAKAKHAKANLQLKEETEKFLREKQSLLENMNELQKKCTQLTTNELQLRTELGDYTSKYEEFQAVLNKSNQVFANFKTDMETTSKKIKKLEKETNLWKKKWENSNNALLEMVTDKQKRDKELLNAQQRILTLEKLCRALQSERNDLQNKVKGFMCESSQTSSEILSQENTEPSTTVAAIS